MKPMAASGKTISILSFILIFFSFVAANFRPFVFAIVLPATDTEPFISLGWLEAEIWIVPFVLMVLLLSMEKQLTVYLSSWKDNWSLILFILLAFLSLSWTVSLSETLVKALVLFFSSALGAHIGLRHDLRRILDILFWFGAISILLSFVLGIFPPHIGRLFDGPYVGAWRGIFWHKNHLGSIGALINLVFLVRAIYGFQDRRTNPILDVFFYLASLVLVYLARSAAGYILIFILNLTVFLIVIWLHIRHRLQPIHYYFGVAAFGLVLLGTVVNLDFIFKLLNRTPTLTGRTPLWAYLISGIVYQQPWFGYGFGALWSLESFRRDMQMHVGWSNPVVIGDNGFLDILLGLGIVGFLLFLTLFIRGWVRSIRFAFSGLSIIHFFPILFFLFVLVSNISFSLFLETNSLIWMLMVSFLFLCNRGGEKTGNN